MKEAFTSHDMEYMRKALPALFSGGNWETDVVYLGHIRYLFPVTDHRPEERRLADGRRQGQEKYERGPFEVFGS